MCTDDEGAEIWKEREYRARKAYECYECNRVIPKGERYIYIWSMQDGDVCTYHVHRVCEALRDFVRDVFCGGHGYIPMGGLDEEIEEVDGYGDYVDFNAWDEAELDQPRPMHEVFEFIKASYPMPEARP